MDDQELIQTFLIESTENLERVDQEMVALESDASNLDLLSSVFRAIHTIKGTCGFLGFNRLEALTHTVENILSDLRGGHRQLTQPLTSLLLEAMDAIKRFLASIEKTGTEGEPFEADLLARLKAAMKDDPAPASISAPSPQAGPAPPAPAAGEPPRAPQAADSTVRVDVGLLDRLMNLAGELVLTRNQFLQLEAARHDASLASVGQRLNLVTKELQQGVMKTRMQPIGTLWNKLPRVVRDLAASMNKEIGLEMEGAETELDRTLIEAFKDPLTHIVRNSCDHGIEAPQQRLAAGKPARGKLALRAFHEGGQVIIEVADDGAGIDPQRVRAKAVERGLITAEQSQQMSAHEATQLVFLPGFSTAASVTNISGRGVGMDVVRTHIERVGGAVDLVSAPGAGTTVRVKLPLTLAIIPGLVVRAGGERFIIPQVTLQELIRVEGEEAARKVEFVHQTPVFRLRAALLPLVDLCGILRLPPHRPPGELSIAVLQNDDYRFGLVVDQICDTEEIVVKPLGQHLKEVPSFAGATIMGDGRIALILDVPGIAALGGVLDKTSSAEAASRAARRTADAGDILPAGRPQSVLLFRAGRFARLALPLDRVARLEEAAPACVEWAAGRSVMQYRDQVMPLIDLGGWLDAGDSACPVAAHDQEPLHIVVHSDGAAALGLVVDEIIDIVEEVVTHWQGSSRPGVAGSAVVGGKLTDFLDLDAVARSVSPDTSTSLSSLDALFRQSGSGAERVEASL